jgi:hypothetical protein
MLIYDGRPVQAWGNEMIRRCCEMSNWDGIVPRAENQLREKGHRHRIQRKEVDRYPEMAGPFPT